MGNSGLLKSALFFLCVTLVVLLVMPKDCARKAAGPIAALRRATTPRQKGLHIETSTPAPKWQQVTYPAGIDAARLQYLIEIDSRFAAQKTMSCPKQSGGVGDVSLVTALQALHYIEPQPDGSYAFTREGLLNVAAADDGSSWSVPIAKRQFVHVDAIDCSAADQCAVTFTWNWLPNDVGKAMQPPAAPQSGSARIVGGPGGWVVSDVSGIDPIW